MTSPLPWRSRLTVSTLCFRHLGLAEALAAVAAAGVGAVDVGGMPGYCEHFDPAGTTDALESWAAVVAQSGLRVHTLNVVVGAFNDPLADVAEVERRARHCLAAAARVGAHGVTFAPGVAVDRNARPLAGELARVAPRFRVLAQRAQDQGLVLTFEAPHRGGLIHHAAEALALVEACAHPAMKLIFDVGHHLRAGWTLADAWACVGRHVDHVHLKDQAAGKGRYPLGAGQIDFGALFRDFARSGYTGGFGLEFPDAAATPEEVVTLLRQSVDHLALVHEGIAPASALRSPPLPL